jgi:hypothetical protein
MSTKPKRKTPDHHLQPNPPDVVFNLDPLPGGGPWRSAHRQAHLDQQILLAGPSLRDAEVLGLLHGSNSAPAETVELPDGDKTKVTYDPAYCAWQSRD